MASGVSLFLARRAPVVVGGLALVGAVVIGLHVYFLAGNLARSNAEESARFYAYALDKVRAFYGREVVGRVGGLLEVTHAYRTQPDSIPIPATFAIDLGEAISDNALGLRVRIWSDYPFPLRQGGGVHDEFERQAIAALRADPGQPFFRFEDYQGRPTLRYGTAIRMEQTCVDCHNHHPDSPVRTWKVGDVRGVQEIDMPLDAMADQAQAGLWDTAMLMGVGVSGSLLLLGLTLRGLRGSVRRAEELAERSASDKRALEREVQERKRAEREIENYSQHLEDEVAKRTAELRQRKGEVEEALAALQDMQNQLVVREKMASLGELTAGIAHEIKNPLNFVKNFAELCGELSAEVRDELAAQDGPMQPSQRNYLVGTLDDIRQNAQKVVEHGQRADAIIRSMLTHSRTSNGEREAVPFNALVEQFAALAYHGLKAQDATFRVALKTDLDPTIGDVPILPQELSRAVLNIVTNACYAAHQRELAGEPDYRPGVWVYTADLGDRVAITILDNGTGIPPQVVEKIFNPFFTTKPAGQGTGLGLSIAWDVVVRQHAGTLHVESEEGHFALFVLILPKSPRF
ncbi:ATP-binding protein [Zavarzinia sp. CC-PAN008]|uniref:ATP-binding protein n=1 Tax=Zavarzinia sp. CC-PAN008 TaxID=3243332 RepID=UPI003F745004